MEGEVSEPKYLDWAEEIRQRYQTGESAMFVLHNNITDVFPFEADYVSSRDYVQKMLERGNYIVIRFDVSRGMRFANDEEAERFVKLANLKREPEAPLIKSIYDFPKDSIKALAYIEAFIVGLSSESRPVAVILEYANQLAPNGTPQTLTEVDRINAVTLQRFASLFYDRLQDQAARDAVCFLMTPNLHELNPDLVRSEVVKAIEIPRPDDAQRKRYVQWLQAKSTVEGKDPVELEVSVDQFVEQTAGLTLRGIRHLFLQAGRGQGKKLTTAYIMARKRELIERDSHGMLEVIMPKHGLDAVGGNAAIKTFLTQTADDLQQARTDVPVGIVCPGPNGVGKTFIAKAFARDCGINCVVLKNFRGMYVGQTESNLDRIFNILKSMTPNVVIMDEADKMLGNEQSSDSNKVDERVFGAFTAFMGDPEYRGKIFWLLLTARPFNLAPDTGRPGRVEEHLPILAPETLQDKREVLEAVLKYRKIKLVGAEGSPQDSELEGLFEDLGFVTPAALELITNRARRVARRSQGQTGDEVSVSVELLREEAQNYVPEGSKSKLLLQTIEAVLYTNRLSYLPTAWADKLKHAPDELSAERERLRRLVGYD